MIQEGYIYIDKTKHIYELIQGKYYFLSRPRRFGKSLLISTLKEIFSGNQALFQGLWIYDQINWEKHPIIHLDFSIIENSKGRVEFEKSLSYYLDKSAKDYGLVLDEIGNKQKLVDLVEKIYQKYGKVVILIDEYDKPIIDNIENFAKAKENKEILASFYEVIKAVDAYTKFVFITGVSRFSKVSIFSKLNNLKDITLREEYTSLCGYTQAELEAYFADYLQILSRKTNWERPQLLQKIKKWYNGYKWGGQLTIYNPFAILNLFDSKEFKNYWFQTATPAFLIKLIREQRIEVRDFEGYLAGAAIFDSFDLEKLHPAALLFQTGYLTIKKEEDELYEFSYPNYEVRESFLTHLLADFSGLAALEVAPVYKKMLAFLKRRDLQKFETALVALFAGIPAQLHLDHESYYHSLAYLILALLGAQITLEEQTDKGRIDAVLKLEEVIYIIEFKLDKAEAALDQIKKKRYHEKYLGDEAQLILLGVGGFREKQIQVVSEVWDRNK